LDQLCMLSNPWNSDSCGMSALKQREKCKKMPGALQTSVKRFTVSYKSV